MDNLASKAPVKKGKKKVSSTQAKALAGFLKNKKGGKVASKAPVDAEDLADGGVDEDKEKE